jgi:hypothetical protein
LWYIKTNKAASSTAAAVTLQIATNVAQRKFGQKTSSPCMNHVKHHTDYSRRKEPNLLWTTLREPAKRTVSHYFFLRVSRGDVKPTPSQMIQYLGKSKNFQIGYVAQFHNGNNDTSTTGAATKKGKATIKYSPIETATPSQIKEMIHEIIGTYHFIGLADRMDESLVVMKLLFHLEDEDIITLSSKRAGGFDDGRKGQCYKIQKSYSFPEVDDFIAGGFQVKNYDYFLYAVANRTLDLTIDELGRKRVEAEVKNHKRLQRLAEDHCNETTVVVPCTKEGPPNKASATSCFFGDVGCGHECVQQTLKKYKEGLLRK